jgi:hypothetical protein
MGSRGTLPPLLAEWMMIRIILMRQSLSTL